MAGTLRPRLNLKLRALTLAEIVGVAALVIAALGYWDAHRERLETEQARQAQAQAAALKSSFVLKGQVAKKGDLVRLAPVDADQVIQTQTLWFPKDVRAGKVETTGDPRLEAGWIADGVRKLAGRDGPRIVPVVVRTDFIQDGQSRTDTSVYDLAYSLRHRLLLPDRVELDGLSLARRGVKGDPQATADTLWSKAAGG